MIDIFDGGFAANPWSVLGRLRDEGGVHRVRTPDGPPAWLITRYADVRTGLLDDRLSTHIRHAGDRDYRGFTVPAPLDANLLNTEPDDHARLRRIVTAEISPRRLTEWTQSTPDLVESWLSAAETGEVDLVAGLVVPLPAAVLGELLGLAAPEREALLWWANSTLRPAAEPPRARDTLTTMLAIVTATITRARTQQADTVLARLVVAHDQDGSLSADELAGLLFYLLFVWYEVLVDLIAGSVLALLIHRDQDHVLCVERDRLAAVVDELTRYLSPQVLAGPRFAVTDLRIGAHTIRAGQTVLLCLAGANHDPAEFDNPDRLDLTRRRNSQLGLGYGPHACLGAVLIRTVAGEVLDQIFTRWPDARLAVDEQAIGWRSGFRHRGPHSLPVRLS